MAPEDELIASHAPKLGQRIKSYAKSNGETRKSFSSDIASLQGQIEHKQYMVRQAMVRQDHWMDLVRASIEG